MTLRVVRKRTVVLDAEAVSATARAERGMVERIAAARQLEQRVVIPSIVLAELLTGKPSDAVVYRVIKRVVVVDLTAQIASVAGRLRDQAVRVRGKKRDLTVDAVVAATAAEAESAIVLTGDPGDMGLLLAGTSVKVIGLDAG